MGGVYEGGRERKGGGPHLTCTTLGRGLDSQLFGVEPWDPVALSVIAVVVFGVAGLASLIPALQAARVDPAVSLRGE